MFNILKAINAAILLSFCIGAYLQADNIDMHKDECVPDCAKSGMTWNGKGKYDLDTVTRQLSTDYNCQCVKSLKNQPAGGYCEQNSHCSGLVPKCDNNRCK